MHLPHQVSVAAQAVFMCHAPIHRRDADRLGECVERKSYTVVQAIDRLDCVLCNEIVMWCMAVIACSHRLVAGMIPCIELITHDMAVHTSLRII